MINIGDTLYDASFGLVEAIQVTEIRQTGKGTIIVAVSPVSENEFPESEVGKSIFQDRDEALAYVRREHGHAMEIIWDEEDC